MDERMGDGLMRRSLEPPFLLHGGYCWFGAIDDLSGQCDSARRPTRSLIRLFEDGAEIGPPHTPHSEISALGQGRFSAWDGRVFFAPSDNSDPNENGRRYEVEFAEVKNTLDPSAFTEHLLASKSAHSAAYTKPAIDMFFAELLDRRHFVPCGLNDEKEYALAKLINELSVVQGGSARTLAIADLYLQKALRHFKGDLSGHTVLEIGPGSNLGAGIVFRHHGAARYYGVELYTDADFNRASVLSTIEVLTRLKYGTFSENMNRLRLGFVPSVDSLDDTVDLSDQNIELLKPKAFWQIPLPDQSVDYVFSNFTFEHLQRVEETVAEIARVLKPGGSTAHFVDIEDHTDFSRPFGFLKFGREEWEARYRTGTQHLYMNRYRASDYRRAFEAAGLTITNCEALASREVTDEDMAGFHPDFQRYDPSDIGVLHLMIEATRTR